MDRVGIARAYFDSSVALARSGSYVSALDRIYHVSAAPSHRREDPEALQQVIELIRSDDFEAATRLLLDPARFPRFPVSIWHASMLRTYPEQITSDPIAVTFVSDYLRDAGLNEDSLVAFYKSPPAANRRTNGFRDWTAKGAKTADPETGEVLRLDVLKGWLDERPGPWLVAGEDDKLGELARPLGVARKTGKGLDLLARARSGLAVAGEAKLVSTTGGNQDKSIRELMDFVEDNGGDALRVAVIDGYVWLELAGMKDPDSQRLEEWVPEGTKVDLLGQLRHAARYEGRVFVSALLLPDLLRSL